MAMPHAMSGAEALSRSDDDDGVQLARQLQAVDWTCAWLTALAARSRPWQHTLSRGAHAWRSEMNAQAIALGLSTESRPADSAGSLARPSSPICFVAQSELPPGAAYEAHIAASGAVPTRANLHDFFNAAMWFSFPDIKAALNARQAGQISCHGIQPTRGGVRDALTLFDENAILLACADRSLAEALHRFDWQTLFLARRDGWGRLCEAWPFGHALLEKLVVPYKAITAHAWIVDVPPAYFGWPQPQRRAYLDRTVADQIASVRTPRDFAPLPVLGIPGWWAANADPAFYADPQVFRTGRHRR